MIERRRFLARSAAAVVAASLPAAAPAMTPSRVLVHRLAEADFAGCALLDGANPFWQEAAVAAIADQEAAILRLQAAGARIVELVDLLDQAIGRAKVEGAWPAWLAAHFPEVEITADAAALLQHGGLLSLTAPDARQAALVDLALGHSRATPLGEDALLLA